MIKGEEVKTRQQFNKLKKERLKKDMFSVLITPNQIKEGGGFCMVYWESPLPKVIFPFLFLFVFFSIFYFFVSNKGKNNKEDVGEGMRLKRKKIIFPLFFLLVSFLFVVFFLSFFVLFCFVLFFLLKILDLNLFERCSSSQLFGILEFCKFWTLAHHWA